MDKSIAECISQLNNEIIEKQNQIQILENLNINEVVDEDTWHKLCQTPLRTSNILARLILNVFPNATEIQVHCNYVYFVLYGFKVQIPTSLCRGINVNPDWFHEYTKPNKIFSQDEMKMKKYFECIDNHAGWYDCARYRLGTRWRKWYLCVIWWVKYKWKDAHREDWEIQFTKAEKSYQDRLNLFHENKKQMFDKITIFVEKVLPEINKFSTEHYNYDGNYLIGIDKILNAYKMREDD